MKCFYLIFRIDSNSLVKLLHITDDYYYFRRLCKMYDSGSIIKKRISLFDLYDSSKFL